MVIQHAFFLPALVTRPHPCLKIMCNECCNPLEAWIRGNRALAFMPGVLPAPAIPRWVTSSQLPSMTSLYANSLAHSLFLTTPNLQLLHSMHARSSMTTRIDTSRSVVP